MSSNPGTVYWMDMTFFTLICCRNCNDVFLKRPKINEKEAGVGTFLKNISIEWLKQFTWLFSTNQRVLFQHRVTTLWQNLLMIFGPRTITRMLWEWCECYLQLVTQINAKVLTSRICFFKASYSAIEYLEMLATQCDEMVRLFFNY